MPHYLYSVKLESDCSEIGKTSPTHISCPMATQLAESIDNGKRDKSRYIALLTYFNTFSIISRGDSCRICDLDSAISVT